MQDFEILSVRVPTGLLDRVRIRILDPRTGIARYGQMKRIVVEALEVWLKMNA